MKAEIISIGNELLIGDTVNTNASWLGHFLTALGFEVTRIHTISDREELIKETVQLSMLNADLVISTGGLGPTHDDITKKAVAELFGADFRLDPHTLDYIKMMFRKRNIPFSESNKAQAEVPENAEVLFNKAGTAPGMWFSEGGRILVVLPGVPYEMKYIMNEHVAAKLRDTYGDIGYLHSRYIKTAGIGESTLSDKVIGDTAGHLQNGIELAYLPAPGGVTLRLNARGQSKEEAEDKLRALADFIYEKAGPYIYGEGKETDMSESVGQLLKEKGLSIATAESCTGGGVAHSITNIPGSSAYMKGGIVAYANDIKQNLLNVNKEDLDREGAVSKTVALQMAEGAAAALNADIGISTTGVAGPGGGSEEKPVGTVWLGFFMKNGPHFAVKAMFTKDRLLNKERSRMVILEVCRRVLQDIDEMPYDLKKQFA